MNAVVAAGGERFDTQVGPIIVRACAAGLRAALAAKEAGNGLLTATVLGRLTGESAAEQIQR